MRPWELFFFIRGGINYGQTPGLNNNILLQIFKSLLNFEYLPKTHYRALLLLA